MENLPESLLPPQGQQAILNEERSKYNLGIALGYCAAITDAISAARKIISRSTEAAEVNVLSQLVMTINEQSDLRILEITEGLCGPKSKPQGV